MWGLQPFPVMNVVLQPQRPFPVMNVGLQPFPVMNVGVTTTTTLSQHVKTKPQRKEAETFNFFSPGSAFCADSCFGTRPSAVLPQ